MSGSKHEKSKGPSQFTSDLDRNPGIGQSKGSFATGEDPAALEGGNTVRAMSRTTLPRSARPPTTSWDAPTRSLARHAIPRAGLEFG